jgi:hypothetical protein
VAITATKIKKPPTIEHVKNNMNCAFFISRLAEISFFSFSFWDRLDILGPVMVLIGVGDELWLLIKKLPKDATPSLEFKRHRHEIVALLWVVVGVALELVAVPHTLLEAAELKSANIQLEIKMQPRRITQAQVNGLTKILGSAPKKPVWILCSLPTQETTQLATQVRRILDSVGYAVGATPYPGSGSGTSVDGIFISTVPLAENVPKTTLFILVSQSDIAQRTLPHDSALLLDAFNSVGIKASLINARINPEQTVVFVANKEGF